MEETGRVRGIKTWEESGCCRLWLFVVGHEGQVPSPWRLEALEGCGLGQWEENGRVEGVRWECRHGWARPGWCWGWGWP